jgi:uncharacterized surface protein with fasciclin (FAS1) repeats
MHLMFRKLISGFAVLGISVVALGGVAGAKSVVVPPSRATADIVSIAQNDGRFTTLLAAVGCANPAVGAALTSGEQLTVFAPTDQAFQNAGLNAGNVCQALDQSTLTSVLLFHVTEGRRFSNSVLPHNVGQVKTIETLLTGRSFTVNSVGTIGGTSTIPAPQIIIPNIAATNGVIHAVDQVLLP